jgi:putative ABC transport system ATP-binding protein
MSVHAPVPGPASVPDLVLELRDVVKEYAGQPPVRALDGVDLAVERGEALAIVGPSGSGKSTLLNLVGALDRPSSGSVRIAGREAAQRNDRELSELRASSIGFVFQHFQLVDGLDAAENVATGLLYRGVGRAERRMRALDALERVGLETRATHRPSQLSGGEQQRVAIARAIVGAPDMVLADEPTGNLDSRTGRAILDLLLSLHAAGVTLVVITHDSAIASRFERVVTLRDGRIVEDTGRATAFAASAGGS